MLGIPCLRDVPLITKEGAGREQHQRHSVQVCVCIMTYILRITLMFLFRFISMEEGGKEQQRDSAVGEVL